ncbi:hypothetical protein [Oceanobacter mangrovi]|uniref:hypothetical protein n=1 Tax=Oceanobacter mangrovi TaxID=2862510 RepID=UPI001C8DB06B|nr:hypothetical protein [Oceanobacter mangrovi]
MHRLLIIALSAVTTTACSGQTGDSQTENQHFCIPDHREVRIDLSYSSDPNFDSDDGAEQSLQAEFSAEEIAAAINGYKSTVIVRDSQLYQGIYLMLDKRPQKREVPQPQPDDLQPLASGLYTADKSTFLWRAYKPDAEGDFQYWGDCFDYIASTSGYSCHRMFYFDDWEVTFEIDHQNIPVSDQVDDFIRQQLTSWRCKK